MAGKAVYELHQRAYVKLLLHSLKHPSVPIHGVLLGSASAGSESTPASVVVEDSVPLFHSRTVLAPMLEMALLQVEEYCLLQQKNLSIVGYYYANELYSDRELGPVPRRIGDHVAKYCPQACVLLVDSELLTEAVESKVSQPALQLYIYDSSKVWRQAKNSGGSSSAELTLSDPTAPELLIDYVAEERYRRVVDFEDHLDDISKDWLNPNLFD